MLIIYNKSGLWSTTVFGSILASVYIRFVLPHTINEAKIDFYSVMLAVQTMSVLISSMTC